MFIVLDDSTEPHLYPEPCCKLTPTATLPKARKAPKSSVGENALPLVCFPTIWSDPSPPTPHDSCLSASPSCSCSLECRCFLFYQISGWECFSWRQRAEALSFKEVKSPKAGVRVQGEIASSGTEREELPRLWSFMKFSPIKWPPPLCCGFWITCAIHRWIIADSRQIVAAIIFFFFFKKENCTHNNMFEKAPSVHPYLFSGCRTVCADKFLWFACVCFSAEGIQA